MVVITNLNKKKKGPRDKVYGEDPYQGTLGITKEDDFKNDGVRPSPFTAKQKDNADYRDFYTNATTFAQMAPLSQSKYDNLSVDPFSRFEFPVNNSAVDYWTTLYHDGAKKGLISVEDEVGTWSVAHLASQPANSGASTINPNEANKFPSKGIAI